MEMDTPNFNHLGSFLLRSRVLILITEALERTAEGTRSDFDCLQKKPARRESHNLHVVALYKAHPPQLSRIPN